jgi:GNAT superfamily N-acetyltransferase
MSIAPANGTSCRDWRTCDASDVTPLVEAEVRAWRQSLSWDVAEAWSVLEPARLAGQLPGLVAFDAEGRPAGWTAYLPHSGHLQVMALVARDGATASALVADMLESAEARTCASVIFCVRDAAPGLADILRQRRFEVDVYRYLVRDLADVVPMPHAFDHWQGHDDAMAALCAAAYRDSAGVRAFAPDGTWPEWQQYVATLVQGTACGWFLPELSLVVPTDVPARALREGPTSLPPVRRAGVQAGVMLTDLGTGAAHLAQLAVDPAARGRGLGRQLVSAAIGEASRFYNQMSLLVSGANEPAVRLYASLGFQDHATFTVASRSSPVA